ncbi:hypothetical protein [Tenuibacillus multivorans]|nr:hypothetical protein [Tenuibacillus multivorans]
MTFDTVYAMEELVFESIPSGNFAMLHLNKEELFLINTGNSTSYEQVFERLEEFDDKHIKGILITKLDSDNCGNLSEILDDYQVDNIYLPKRDDGQCFIPENDTNRVFRLNDQEMMAISSRYYIKYVYNETTSTGNFAISNGQFISFWYEGIVDYDKWDEKVKVLYLPESTSIDQINEDDLVKLDPQVAIINKQNQTESLIQMFQQQWVDLYSLRHGASAHVMIEEDEYDLYLKKE